MSAATGQRKHIHVIEGDRQPYPLVATRANKQQAQFSPDGRWLGAGRSPQAGHGGWSTMKLRAEMTPYDILSIIGAGGMGEVFRARDTRLDRDEAAKVLPRGIPRKQGGRSFRMHPANERRTEKRQDRQH